MVEPCTSPERSDLFPIYCSTSSELAPISHDAFVEVFRFGSSCPPPPPRPFPQKVLICNDQWTPALRPIRAIAKVFVFKAKSSPARLVQRLKVLRQTAFGATKRPMIR